jgi:dihydropteroate synthase
LLGHLLATSDRRAAAPPLPGLGADAVAAKVRATPTDDRIEGSISAAVWAVAHGAQMVRAHDVRPTVDAVGLVAA